MNTGSGPNFKINSLWSNEGCWSGSGQGMFEKNCHKTRLIDLQMVLGGIAWYLSNVTYVGERPARESEVAGWLMIDSVAWKKRWRRVFLTF